MASRSRLPSLARSWPLLVALLLGVAGLTPILASSDGSPYQAGPGQAGTMGDQLEALGYHVANTHASPTAILTWEPSTTVLVVIDPASGYTTQEADHIADWVDRGGRLLVADGTGGALPILEALGVDSDQRRIFDASLTAGSVTKVPATYQGQDGELAVTLDAPLAIGRGSDQTPGFQALAGTGTSSFLDLDGDRELDPGDTRGPFTVAASVSQGRAILLTSGYPLLDQAADQADHRALAEDLVTRLLPEGGTVVFDTSHGARSPGLDASGDIMRSTMAVATDTPAAFILPALVALGAGWLTLRRTDVQADWTRKGPSPEEVTAPSRAFDAGTLVSGLEALADEGQETLPGGDQHAELLAEARALEGKGPRRNGT